MAVKSTSLITDLTDRSDRTLEWTAQLTNDIVSGSGARRFLRYCDALALMVAELVLLWSQFSVVYRPR